MKLTRVGDILRRMRVERKELLYDMAVKLDTTPSHISEIEIGITKMSNELANKLIDAYNLNFNEIREIKGAIQ